MTDQSSPQLKVLRALVHAVGQEHGGTRVLEILEARGHGPLLREVPEGQAMYELCRRLLEIVCFDPGR